MAILISLNILFKKHITMKKLIFSFIVVATERFLCHAMKNLKK